jgi:hypothetical protein
MASKIQLYREAPVMQAALLQLISSPEIGYLLQLTTEDNDHVLP